jgi:hypothetical protein
LYASAGISARTYTEVAFRTSVLETVQSGEEFVISRVKQLFCGDLDRASYGNRTRGTNANAKKVDAFGCGMRTILKLLKAWKLIPFPAN